MHLYLMIRGARFPLKMLEEFLSSQMWPWKRKNLTTGKEETQLVQGSLREIKLYEYVFPEECRDDVLSMFRAEEQGWGIGQTKLRALRHALGLKVKPIPKYVKKPARFIPIDRGIALYPLGIKKDRRKSVKEWNYEQEML